MGSLIEQGNAADVPSPEGSFDAHQFLALGDRDFLGVFALLGAEGALIASIGLEDHCSEFRLPGECH